MSIINEYANNFCCHLVTCYHFLSFTAFTVLSRNFCYNLCHRLHTPVVSACHPCCHRVTLHVTPHVTVSLLMSPCHLSRPQVCVLRLLRTVLSSWPSADGGGSGVGGGGGGRGREIVSRLCSTLGDVLLHCSHDPTLHTNGERRG